MKLLLGKMAAVVAILSFVSVGIAQRVRLFSGSRNLKLCISITKLEDGTVGALLAERLWVRTVLGELPVKHDGAHIFNRIKSWENNLRLLSLESLAFFSCMLAFSARISDATGMSETIREYKQGYNA